MCCFLTTLNIFKSSLCFIFKLKNNCLLWLWMVFSACFSTFLNFVFFFYPVLQSCYIILTKCFDRNYLWLSRWIQNNTLNMFTTRDAIIRIFRFQRKILSLFYSFLLLGFRFPRNTLLFFWGFSFSIIILFLTI